MGSATASQSLIYALEIKEWSVARSFLVEHFAGRRKLKFCAAQAPNTKKHARRVPPHVSNNTRQVRHTCACAHQCFEHIEVSGVPGIKACLLDDTTHRRGREENKSRSAEERKRRRGRKEEEEARQGEATRVNLVRRDELLPRRLEARLVDSSADRLARLCPHHQVRRRG